MPEPVGKTTLSYNGITVKADLWKLLIPGWAREAFEESAKYCVSAGRKPILLVPSEITLEGRVDV